MISDKIEKSEWIQASERQTEAVRNNALWLAENAAQYEGEWVALDNGQLLGHSKLLKDLKKNLKYEITSEILFTKLVE